MANTTIKRVLCLATVFCFVTTQCITANPGAGIEIVRQREIPSFFQIDIPNELATLEGIFEAPVSPDPRLILHIQNAHANYGAQIKIKELIGYLKKTYAFRTIFVEGASEDLNPDYLRMFPDQERNMKLAEFLAQQGEMTGAELYLMEDTSKDVLATGIEDAQLYRDNYEALKEVFSSETITVKYLSGLEERLETLSSKVFSNDLRKLLSEWKKFEKGNREFIPYVKNLANEAKRILDLDLNSLFAQIEWPQLTRLLVLQSMEADLDRSKALEEKSRLLEFLRSKKLSKLLIQGIENFQDQRVSIHRNASGDAGEMLPRDLLEQLVMEAGPKGFRFHDYPNFSLYAGYLILKNELDPKSLFGEIQLLFQKLLDEITETPRQKVLLELWRDEEMVRKLLNLELTRRNWQEVLEKRTILEMDTLVSRLKDIAAAVSAESNLKASDFEVKKVNPKFRDAVMRAYEAAFRFYDFARKREEVFYKKIDAAMQKDGVNKAILITGGFHTDGITDLLREHEVSYGILTPRLSEKSNEQLYRTSMLQGQSSLFDLATLELFSKMQQAVAMMGQGADLGQELKTELNAFFHTFQNDSRDVREALDFLKMYLSRRYGMTLSYEVKGNDFVASFKSGQLTDPARMPIQVGKDGKALEIHIVRLDEGSYSVQAKYGQGVNPWISFEDAFRPEARTQQGEQMQLPGILETFPAETPKPTVVSVKLNPTRSVELTQGQIRIGREAGTIPLQGEVSISDETARESIDTVTALMTGSFARTGKSFKISGVTPEDEWITGEELITEILKKNARYNENGYFEARRPESRIRSEIFSMGVKEQDIALRRRMVLDQAGRVGLMMLLDRTLLADIREKSPGVLTGLNAILKRQYPGAAMLSAEDLSQVRLDGIFTGYDHGLNKNIYRVQLQIQGKRTVTLAVATKQPRAEPQSRGISKNEIAKIKEANEKTNYNGTLAPVFIKEYYVDGNPANDVEVYYEEYVDGMDFDKFIGSLEVIDPRLADGQKVNEIEKNSPIWQAAVSARQRAAGAVLDLWDAFDGQAPMDINQGNIRFREGVGKLSVPFRASENPEEEPVASLLPTGDPVDLDFGEWFMQQSISLLLLRIMRNFYRNDNSWFPLEGLFDVVAKRYGSEKGREALAELYYAVYYLDELKKPRRPNETVELQALRAGDETLIQRVRDQFSNLNKSGWQDIAGTAEVYLDPSFIAYDIPRSAYSTLKKRLLSYLEKEEFGRPEARMRSESKARKMVVEDVVRVVYAANLADQSLTQTEIKTAIMRWGSLIGLQPDIPPADLENLIQDTIRQNWFIKEGDRLRIHPAAPQPEALSIVSEVSPYIRPILSLDLLKAAGAVTAEEKQARLFVDSYPIEQLISDFLILDANSENYRIILQAMSLARNMLSYAALRQVWNSLDKESVKRQDLTTVLTNIANNGLMIFGGGTSAQSNITRRTWAGRSQRTFPLIDQEVDAKASAEQRFVIGDFAVSDGTSAYELALRYQNRNVQVIGYDLSLRFFILPFQIPGDESDYQAIFSGQGKLAQVIRNGKVIFPEDVYPIWGVQTNFENFSKVLEPLLNSYPREKLSDMAISLINPEAEEFAREHPEKLQFREHDVFEPLEQKHDLVRVLGLLMRRNAYFQPDQIKEALGLLGATLSTNGLLLNGTLSDEYAQLDVFRKNGADRLQLEQPLSLPSWQIKTGVDPTWSFEGWQTVNVQTSKEPFRPEARTVTAIVDAFLTQEQFGSKTILPILNKIIGYLGDPKKEISWNSVYQGSPEAAVTFVMNTVQSSLGMMLQRGPDQAVFIQEIRDQYWRIVGERSLTERFLEKNALTFSDVKEVLSQTGQQDLSPETEAAIAAGGIWPQGTSYEEITKGLQQVTATLGFRERWVRILERLERVVSQNPDTVFKPSELPGGTVIVQKDLPSLEELTEIVFFLMTNTNQYVHYVTKSGDRKAINKLIEVLQLKDLRDLMGEPLLKRLKIQPSRQRNMTGDITQAAQMLSKAIHSMNNAHVVVLVESPRSLGFDADLLDETLFASELANSRLATARNVVAMMAARLNVNKNNDPQTNPELHLLNKQFGDNVVGRVSPKKFEIYEAKLALIQTLLNDIFAEKATAVAA